MTITVDDFKQALGSKSFTDRQIVQRYLIYGDPFVYAKKLETYYLLKEEIAKEFHTHPHNVIMVGSAKLGFSIAPNQLWKPFSDESDIDIVIVSEVTFREYWEQLFLFNINTARNQKEEENFKKFKDYFFKGWIRPDLFDFRFDKKNHWFDFFKSATRKYGDGRKITGALYHNFSFFEKYHMNNLNSIRNPGGSNV